MFPLKPLSKEAIPRALAEAERFRLLNEPVLAESICADVLLVDPHNQLAVRTLLLAMTEQFDQGISFQNVTELLPCLQKHYDRQYFTGLVYERRAISLMRQNDYRSSAAIYELLREAMCCYERAEAVQPAGNEDALLRWNTCARVLARSPYLLPKLAEDREPLHSDIAL